MHEAEQYLRNPETPNYLYVQYQGRRRRLFFNPDQNICCIIGIRKRRWGFGFSDWGGIEKIFKPLPVNDPTEINRRLIHKFQREAVKATFTNKFIRNIQHADYSKSLYKNGITTGTRIDGQIITLEAVRKWCGERTYQSFCEAVKTRTAFHSDRFNFRGYDGSLWVEPCQKDDGYNRVGDLNAGFSKEYRGCVNGYYYLLINEKNFIGCDID